ncbi:phage portal protein [Salmonella enterica]|nr:phage portal protein [Salmonella enterica]
MSTKLTGYVWDACAASGMKLSSVAIMARLADFSNDEGVCWPSIETISRQLGAGVSTVRTAIAKLEADGWLSRKARRQGNRNASNVYQLNVAKLQTDNSSNLVQGIYFNEWRRPVKYLVCQSWPGAGAAAVAVKEVTAENMLHLRFTRRLNQARGASLLAPVIIRLMDLKEYEDSERIAARIAASLGMFIKKQDVGTDGYVAPEKRKETQIQPGMLFDGLNPGEDIGMIKSDRPNAGLESFRMGQLRAVAAGLRGSFSSIARNYDGTYSAQRQELVEAQEGYSILQDSFIAAFTRPLYRRWLAAAVASGAIEVPAGTDMSSLFNAVYSGPVMPWIDPLKEANAWRVLIRGGAATEGDWVRARGGAPADVKRRRKAETDENRKLGLVFDTDPAHETGEQSDVKEEKKDPEKSTQGDGSRAREERKRR